MKKYTSIGALLKDYRKREKLTQSEFASLFEVDIRSVIRWEKNETLLNNEKEQQISSVTFIPHQVIRNLNTSTPIPLFYDFDLRKYSLSTLSTDLPDADWIRSRIDVATQRIRPLTYETDVDNIIRFEKLQKDPQKSLNGILMMEAAIQLPELNLIILDQSGHYAGHCVYFSISLDTYQKIRNQTLKESDLEPEHLVNYKHQEKPVFYCHSITADCNENFFYIIGAVLKFYRDTPLKDYIYALLTSRYDSHLMSDQLGVYEVWEDIKSQEKYNLLDVPRLVEGNFKAFLNDKN